MAAVAWTTGADAASNGKAAKAPNPLPAPGRAVETIAALRALAAPFPASIRVQGYFQPGDGGGGDFDFVASDKSPDNGFDHIASRLMPAGRWQRRFDSARISAVSAGVSPQSPQAMNSAGLTAIRDRMRMEDRRWILDLPAGQIDIESSRWLHGVRRVTVNGGPTRIRNNLIPDIGKKISTTECIGLTVNPDLFLDGLGGPKFTYGNFVAGDRIMAVSKGDESVRLADPSAVAAFAAGSPVLVYGFNQSSEGYPPNVRYFDFATIDRVNQDSGEIDLTGPLNYDYSPDWHDIATKSYKTPVGAGRILSLDRPGFRVADSIELNDIEFVASESFEEGVSKLSLRGSLYVPGCLKVVLNRIGVGGHFYPTASKYCEVNDCDIWHCEMDKVVEDLRFTNCRLGLVSNGPAVLRVLFDRCSFGQPVPTLNARDVEFLDCEFASPVGSAAPLVAMAASCVVHSVRFIRPRLNHQSGNAVALTAGGNVFAFNLLDVVGDDLIIPFTGVNDEALRALDIGSVLQGVTRKTSCRILKIQQDGDSATRLVVETTGEKPQAGDRFKANRLWSLSIIDPELLSAGDALRLAAKPYKLTSSLHADATDIQASRSFLVK